MICVTQGLLVCIVTAMIESIAAFVVGSALAGVVVVAGVGQVSSQELPGKTQNAPLQVYDKAVYDEG